MCEMKPMDYDTSYEGLIPEGNFRISPSMLDKFNSCKHEWYRSQVLGEKTFLGNTSTELGKCLHRVAEQYIKTNKVDDAEIMQYIDSIDNFDVDKDYIKQQYEPMKLALLAYLTSNPKPQYSEHTIAKELMKGIYVGGTVDAITSDEIIDFKTTDTMSPIQKIPSYYKWQMLAYAWMLRELGMEKRFLKLIWITTSRVGRVSEKTGKPLKDSPSEIFEIVEEITPQDYEFIESYLRLIGESVLAGYKYPELVYIIFADYRLKGL